MSHQWGNSIPQFIKQYRKDTDCSQASLAEALGINKMNISKVERGLYQAPAFIVWRMLPILDTERGAHLLDLLEYAAYRKVIKSVRRKQ